MPAFLQTSPFTSKLFRATIEHLSQQRQTANVNGQIRDLSSVALEWLHHELTGARLRMAHRCIEWDGWEEGLVESMLGSEDQEEDWFQSWDDVKDSAAADGAHTPQSPQTSTSPTLTESVSEGDGDEGKQRIDNKSGSGGSMAKAATNNNLNPNNPLTARAGGAPRPVKVVASEKAKEKLLNSTGDYCGGRGGELGRRLEAWLCITGDSEGRVELPKRWEGEPEEERREG